jgi:8-oxo-dGTP pyrophosphatase MutT (NUDIX family)
MDPIRIDDALFGIIDYGLGADVLIVLVQDNDKSGMVPMWKFPGGRSERCDGSSENALVRELLEEIGITTQPEIEIHRANHTQFSDAWWVVKPLEPKESIRYGKEIGLIRLATRNECLSLIAEKFILPAHALALGEYLNRLAI